MTPDALFEQVVQASRLNQLIAPFTVSRLLTRSDVAPTELTPQQLAVALPELEQGLRVYLKDDELQAAVADIRALAA